MTVPDWRTSSGGTRVRAALWLHSEIGVGNSFTKQQLREAFPGVEQIDRRMRDLRIDGWVISTYREDRTLSVDELRLVTEGGPVWEKGYQSQQRGALTGKARQAVFAADNFMCVLCGIGAGEAYPDQVLKTAKLTVARVSPADGEGEQLATCCDRCHAGEPAWGDAAEVVESAASLSADQRELLARWVRAGKRAVPPEQVVWARYRRLPHAARDAAAQGLAPD